MSATRLSGTAPSALEDTDLDALAWQALADRLQAVAEPTRLRLLALLRALPEQRACVGDMTRATGLAQPTVSRHLQVLHRAGLLLRTRQGSRTYYQCGAGAIEALARELTAGLRAGQHGPPQVRGAADLLAAVAASAWQGRTTVG